MSQLYKVHEVAALAGITIKALHHYDRLGLLRPQRTDAGYRVYILRDLERLEQIVALKFIGIPLKQIKTLLDRETVAVPQALRLQRRELEQKRRLIDRAIEAIELAETAIHSGTAVDVLCLKKIIEVIAMSSRTDFMQTTTAKKRGRNGESVTVNGPRNNGLTSWPTSRRLCRPIRKAKARQL